MKRDYPTSPHLGVKPTFSSYGYMETATPTDEYCCCDTTLNEELPRGSTMFEGIEAAG